MIPNGPGMQVRSLARIGNVAAAFKACLKAEFPRFSVQRLFACFIIPSGGVERGRGSSGGVEPGVGPSGGVEPRPTDSALHQLRMLAGYLQLDPAREEQLVAQFLQYYPRVVRRCARGLCSKGAWSLELAPAGMTELRRLYCMMVGFFVSETECERLFSVEQRRKPSPMKIAARADILKIKTDGLPLSSLTAGGRPVGGFWFRAQEKYAELHGTRVMKKTVKGYKSKNKKMGNRDERHTLTSFARKRLKAVHEFLVAAERAEALSPRAKALTSRILSPSRRCFQTRLSTWGASVRARRS